MKNNKVKNREWKKVKLGAVCRIKGGFAFKSHDFTSTGTPVVKISEIQNSRVAYSKNTSYLSQDLLNKPALQNYLLRNGDVLIAMTGATTGKIGKFNNGIAFLNQRVGKFEPNERLDNDFIYYLSQTQDFFKAVTGNILASAQGNVSPLKIESVEVNLPSLIEQESIAKVLNTAQDAIMGQGELIEKLKKLKKSMMKHLFTHGTKNESTKMTEIGEIPESWETETLGEELEKTKTKDPTKNPDEEFIYIDVSAVSNEYFTITNVQKILGKHAPSRARKHVLNGDIIFATVRPTLQRIAKITGDCNDQICSTGYCVLRPQTKLDGEYLFQYLCTDSVKDYVGSKETGASYPAIRDRDLFEMKIPFPALSEQINIGRSLKSIDQKIESAQTKLLACQKLFKTLLHELMSGERRIM